MSDDRRRRQYVPLATHFATAKTGTRIQKDFGVEGLGVWACLLAAAKRSQLQGTFIWHSEEDAWNQLGIEKAPSFTFKSFVYLLGVLKQARTRRIGRESHTTLTRFSEWNHAIRSQHEASRKRSKRAQKTADDSADNRAPKEPTEGEGEGETPLPPLRRKSRTRGQAAARTNGAHPYTCPHCGVHPATQGELDDHLELFHPEAGQQVERDPAAHSPEAADLDSEADDIDWHAHATAPTDDDELPL